MRRLGLVILLCMIVRPNAQAQTVSPILGPQAILFVPVTFDGQKPFTRTQATQSLANQGALFRQWSYNQASLVFTVADWVTVPSDAANCNPQAASKNADEILRSRGIEPNTYFKKVYQTGAVSPCGWGVFTERVGGTRVFLQADGPGAAVLHELGHAFGMAHADGLDCGMVVLASTGCNRIGYANIVDPMGQGGGPYDLPHMVLVGWIGQSNGPTLISLTDSPSGTFKIDNLDTPPQGRPKGLRVQRVVKGSPVGWIYVEHRSPPSQGGVWLMLEDLYSDNNNLLLDASPSGTWGDVMLNVGQTFTDPTSGIRITAQAADLSGATLVIATGPVAPPPSPTAVPLSCAPISQTIAMRDNALLTASGGTSPYAWVATGANVGTGSGSTFSTSYDTIGAKAIHVTSGSQTVTCAVTVANTVMPPAVRPPSAGVVPTSVSVTPSHIWWGDTTTGTVTLSAPAKTPVKVELRSYNEAVGVPGDVIIPAGSTSAPFTVWSIARTSPGSAQITASYNGASVSTVFALSVRTP